MNNAFNRRTMSVIILLLIALTTLFFFNAKVALGQDSTELPINRMSTEATPIFVDDFNDNTINPIWWTEYESGGPTVDETNQRLEFDVPSDSSGDAFYSGYTSQFRVGGDFDVEVAYQLLNWPAKNGVRLGLVTGSFSFSPQRVSCGTGESCVDVYLVNNSGNLSTFIDASSHTEGKFRITRQGNTTTGYYFDPLGSNWQQISSASKGTEDVRFTLQTWSHDSYFIDQDVSVAFDNFIVHEGQLIVSEIFAPIVLKK